MQAEAYVLELVERIADPETASLVWKTKVLPLNYTRIWWSSRGDLNPIRTPIISRKF